MLRLSCLHRNGRTPIQGLMGNEGLTVDHLTYLAGIMSKEALVKELTQPSKYALPSCDHASLCAM